jgi:hypothetical protein
VLSTPPAFVLSQDQTLQTKTIWKQSQNISQKLTSKKATPPTRGAEGMAKTTTKNFTKHTIEFSNNTPI